MRRKFERYAVLALLVVSPFWLPSVPNRLGSSFRLGVSEIFRPAILTTRFFTAGFERVVLGVFQWPYLQEENRFLRSRIETLQAHEKTHQQLSEENARLRALLEMKQSVPWRFVPAEVAGREFNAWSSTLLIDRGTERGIRPGMAVIASGGLVGRITDAGRSLSRVTLLNDPRFRISGITASSRMMGLVVGTSSGGVLITYIPLESKLKAGEAVVSSGGVSFCPAGVPIGLVSGIFDDPSHLYLSAHLRPAVDLNALEEVLVITWPFSDSGS